MNKTLKYFIIAVASLVALGLIIWIIKYFIDQNSAGTGPGGNPNPNPSPGTGNAIVDGLGGLINNFIGGFFGKGCDKNNLGFQKDGVYNPDKCGRPAELGCDPNRPGWNIAGLPDVSC
jgi:hypothetical protein